MKYEDDKLFTFMNNNITKEYSFIEKYLIENDLIDTFGASFNNNRYKSYKWNFNSISKPNKKLFLDVWRKQLAENKSSNEQEGFKQRIDEWMIIHLPNSLYIVTAGTAHDVMLKLGIISDV